ncbi:karyopherin KAP120 [Sporobolomyces koalae]|uniref:karyopherin KAP120 n=1 Tax=Sporobolomyces koalae TaxID=500713 RepID=UPI0031746299
MSIPPPSSPSDVIDALSHALSPVPASRLSSLEALQAWSTLPGYYSYLANIFTNREQQAIGDQVRLQALIQLKNGIDKYWRRSAKNAIAAEEKATIRPLLLTMVDEPNRVLAKNLAVTIGKLARLDYGVDWNELPETLLGSLHVSTSLLSLHRSLLYLHATIKSLASNRAPKGRLCMKKLTELLFTPLVNLHASILSQAVERLQRDGLGGEQHDVEEIECALLAFKCLRFLTVYGDQNPAQNTAIKAFFVSTLSTFTSILTLRLSLFPATAPIHSATPRLTFLTKHVVSYTKLYRALIDHNIQQFDQMGITQQTLETYWNVVKSACQAGILNVSDSAVSPYPTRLLIPSLLLLKSTLSSWDGQTPLTIPIEFVKEFAQVLVKDCLRLREEELDKWDEDPEEWINEEELDRWEFELRPCAEYVLISLIGGYKEELGAQLASYLKDPTISQPQDMNGLLLKEAVYTAIGKSAASLAESINFEEWLNQGLVSEVAGTDTNYRIIRRRIAWLLGYLISEDLAAESRPLIYSLIVHLLSRNASTDPAIRLTAARSLQKCDTWDFDLNGFLPLLGSAIEEIVQLLGEVSSSDSLMKLNQTLGVIIARVGEHIVPFAPKLAEILGTLWSGVQDNQPHFQTSILVTMTRLAEALNEQSQSLHPQAAAIIQLSVDSSRSSHIYLQEDALELWQVLLRRSASLSPEMLALLPALVTLVREGTDVLPRCLSIFESFLLLDSTRVIELCGASVLGALSDLLEGLSVQAVKVVLHTLNSIFKTCPAMIWAAPFDESGTFQKLLQGISQTESSALVITKYLGSIARIILSSPETFHQMLASTGARTNTSSDHLLGLVINQFVERLDNMSQAGQRKVVALALANLTATTNPVVLSRLSDLVALWSGVLAQTEETQEGDAELYHVVEDYTSDIEQDYTETLETERRSALSSVDPMITLKLSSFIGQKLSEAQALNGGAEVFQQQWLGQVDPILVEELVKRLEGKPIKTYLTDKLGITVPVVQGGMMWVGLPELVAAVSNAGGLGILTGLTPGSPEKLRESIRKTKQLTSKPFAVNLTFLPSISPPPYAEYAQVVIDEGIKVAETAGGPQAGPIIKMYKQAGIFVIHKCTSIRHAKSAERLGVDMLSIDGFECAGHPGEDDIGGLLLLALAAKNLKIPYIASGGIGDGRGLAAAIALGAQGVNCGTVFMATKESYIHDKIKQEMVEADENQTTHIFRTLKNTARVFKNKIAVQVREKEYRPGGAQFPELAPLVSGLRGKQVYEQGDSDAGVWSASPVMGLIHDIPSCQELLSRMEKEAEQILLSSANKVVARESKL